MDDKLIRLECLKMAVGCMAGRSPTTGAVADLARSFEAFVAGGAVAKVSDVDADVERTEAHFEQANRALHGRRWTAKQADELIALVKAGVAYC